MSDDVAAGEGREGGEGETDRAFRRGGVIGWSCSGSREMISIGVEADNAPPF